MNYFKLKYRKDIDGLRAVSIISVVIYHIFPKTIPGGFVGVDIFFVISGYLITNIIIYDLYQDKFSFIDFYTKRIKRIIPSLLIVLIITFIIGWFVLLTNEFEELAKHIIGSIFFVSNFLLLNEVGYFNTAADAKPLLHLWSLSIEEQFYLFWPLILSIFCKNGYSLKKITIIILAISFLINIIGVYINANATFYSPLSRIWEIMCGALLAVYSKEFKKANYSLFISNIASSVGILLIIFAFYKFDKSLAFPGKWAIAPVMGASLLIIAGENSYINKTILGNKFLVYIGRISFPLYLWHWPLLSFATIMENKTPNDFILISILLISILLSAITYHTIEAPFRAHKFIVLKKQLLFILTMLILFSLVVVSFKSISNKTSTNSDIFTNELYASKLENKKGWLCNKAHSFSDCFYENENISAVIIGDSHAPSIYYGLNELYKSYNKNIAVFGGGGGCPPLLGIISEEQYGVNNNDCLKKIKMALDVIISDNNIRDVYLAARWPLYFSSTGFGDVEKGVYPKWILRSEGENLINFDNELAFQIGLERTIKVLEKSGKNIIFLYDVPELGFHINTCFKTRPISITNNIKSPCAIARTEYDLRANPYKLAVIKILSKYPSVVQIDLSNGICDGDFCYAENNNIPLYLDDDHLNHIGSKYLINNLRSQFNNFLN